MIRKENKKMNEIQVWNYESSEVRTIEKDGEPWFAGKDICDVLGYVKRFLVYHSSYVAELAYRQDDGETLLYCQDIMRKYEDEYISLNQSYPERILRYKHILEYGIGDTFNEMEE